MVLTCLDCTHFQGSDTCAQGWQVEERARGCGCAAAVPIADPSGNKVTASTCPEFLMKRAAGRGALGK